MKTLNEVIKAFECCENGEPDSNCKECSYIGIGSCCLERENDALRYMKEYREKHDEILKMEEALGYCEIMDNQPLTWDELKGMEGVPVWVELLNHGIWDDPSHRVDSEWWVIGEVRKDDIILATYLDEMELCEEDIGVSWQAYRKEREFE